MPDNRRRGLDDTLRQVGRRIRDARLRRQLTLVEVGRRTGLTPSMLSMVERGVAAPSIGALVAIGAALKVPMAALFGPLPARSGLPVVRRGAQRVVTTGRGAQRRLLVRDAHDLVEMAENTYLPGAASAPTPIHHRGWEMGVVLSGRLRVELGRALYVLRRGDAIAFDSSIPHRFTNVGKEVVRTIWVNVHGNRWSDR